MAALVGSYIGHNVMHCCHFIYPFVSDLLCPASLADSHCQRRKCVYTGVGIEGDGLLTF